jgi:3',5'-cyclic AMP phosphodiesterase CpdA
MKFIHLSDLHFHRSKSDNKEITKTLQFIQNQYPDHYIIITGDIVDDGHEKQYACAFEALKPFKGRIFICPGNHDFGAAGNFYSQERAERFDAMLSGPLEQGGTFTRDNTPVVNIVSKQNETVMLIALDTNLETEHFFDFACGQVGEKQLTTLDAILSNPATHKLVKILFFHHHPFMHNNPFMELTDARELMRIMYNRVDAVLFGHKHESREWQQYGGIPFVLAADNSPGKDYAREITVKKGALSVVDLKIA